MISPHRIASESDIHVLCFKHLARRKDIRQIFESGERPCGATDSVGGGNHTAVIPHLDKSAAFGASSRYHFFLQLSQLKPWNLNQESTEYLAKKRGKRKEKVKPCLSY